MCIKLVLWHHCFSCVLVVLWKRQGGHLRFVHLGSCPTPAIYFISLPKHQFHVDEALKWCKSFARTPSNLTTEWDQSTKICPPYLTDLLMLMPQRCNRDQMGRRRGKEVIYPSCLGFLNPDEQWLLEAAPHEGFLEASSPKRNFSGLKCNDSSPNLHLSLTFVLEFFRPR